MDLCHICGNEIAPGMTVCTFCGSAQPGNGERGVPKPFLHRTLNLEEGRPLVEPALNKLQAALREAKMLGIQALTVIHGYGSSGRGGAIGRECRKVLGHMCSKGEVHCVVPGEEFHRRNGVVRDLLKRYPRLAANANLNRGNRGITLVIL